MYLKRQFASNNNYYDNNNATDCVFLIVYMYIYMYSSYLIHLSVSTQNCENDKYHTRDEFLSDLNQIVENSITYNGPTSLFTQTAESMKQAGLKYLEEVCYIHIFIIIHVCHYIVCM